jgi:hypothetical protein
MSGSVPAAWRRNWNFISTLYSLCLAARALGHVDVDVVLESQDATKQQTQLISFRLMGMFPGSASDVASYNSGMPVLTAEQACAKNNENPIGHVIPITHNKLRCMAMAIAFVGVPSAAFAEQYLWTLEYHAIACT